MRILITGGTGFLGSHLCRHLVTRGHQLRVLVRPSADLAALNALPLEYSPGDVTDIASLREAFRDQEVVIHAAASLSQDDVNKLTQVNVVGTEHVTKACLDFGVRRLVHVSSVAAIGLPSDASRPATEDFRFNLDRAPLPYHRSKKLAEQRVMSAISSGLDAVIVNPAWIMGPYGDRFRGAEVLRKVCRSRIVPYFLGGRCAVHVDDVVAGVETAIEQAKVGERYILGGENLSFRSLVERTAYAKKIHPLLLPIPPVVSGSLSRVAEPWARWRNRIPKISRAIHFCGSRPAYYDSSKARRTLGYAPRGFDDILQECLDGGHLETTASHPS